MENNARPNQHLRKPSAFAGGRQQAGNHWLDTGLGKLPPQALDLEEAVLGALMIEKDALSSVVDILKPETFYKEAHQRIYNAILTLFGNSDPIDLLTVTQQLRKTGEIEIVGGGGYVSELTFRVNSAANIEYHARVISEQALKRALISMSSTILRDAYEDTTDVFELLDRTEQSLFKISESNIKKNYADMSTIVRMALNELETKKNQEGLTGVPSGFTNLDRVTSGWQPTELIILAARPAMGKTAFVVSALRNAAVDHGKPVAIFSLEMSSVQLVNRLISAEAEIDSEKIRKGTLAPHEWTQLHHKIQRLTEAPIFIDDTPALSILELRAKCRRLKAQHDIQMVVIDYLQLMSGDTSGKGGGNREQEIASISRALKNLAKELNVPVIALSQLSRAVETRGGDKKPQLSDLRESGSIEQDADMVCFLYRPEYYNITQDENGNSTAGIGEVIIAKNRSGSLDTIQLRFINKFTKFCDLDSYFEPVPTQGFTPEMNGLSSFDAPPVGNVFKSKANDRSNFGHADPGQETPF
ncbi:MULTISPECIES: replicative DNA helicase [Spirosoma]|uniref:Replicative DNA helicase n=1 Tax=Spirosoma liriopis TaxID=2937440 RepID=A0ABT0HP44_9BACT|nr:MULTISPECIES: replicative DNA helicase [Spirosoma]MCK8493950.1 replicative DNA helicase [Spirosoma liriopis]UHG93600.1 replicative DNA helicase [Spirosoma oryzicola]